MDTHKRKFRLPRFTRTAVVLSAAGVIAVSAGSTAYAVSSSTPTNQPGACVQNDHASFTTARWWLHMPLPAHCPSGWSWWPNGMSPNGTSSVSGVSVTKATVNASGDLVLTFSNGTTQDAGHVVGANGTSYTPVTATAVQAVSNRSDSGNNGDWATDAFTRTVTVTRHSAVSVSNCPSGATHCWFYTATLADNGSFTTNTGAKSPNAGANIAGTVMGTMTGGSDIEFYADNGTPTAPTAGTITGNTPSTTNWVDQFFPSGALITTPKLTNWSWTYTAPNTCEKWVDAYNNGDGHQSGDGDITGVNACTSS